MVQQFFSVVAWQPRAKDWRVWQLRKRNKPRRKFGIDFDTKRKTVQAAKEELGASEFGVLVRNKDGSPGFFHAQPNAHWQMAKKTKEIFNNWRNLLVMQSHPGRWNVWTTGPTKGYRSIVSRMDSKAEAVDRAKTESRLEQDVCGVIVMTAENEPNRYEAHLPTWNDIADSRLQKDPAASILR